MNAQEQLFYMKKKWICENKEMILEFIDDLVNVFFSSGTFFLILPKKLVGKWIKNFVSLLIEIYCQSNNLDELQSKLDKVKKSNNV